MQDFICLVVTIARARERQGRIAAELGKIGLAFEFIEGVDAKNGIPDAIEANVDRIAARKWIGREILDGEIGASLAHRYAYQRFLTSNARTALVLEDDAIFGPDLATFLHAGGADAAPMVLLNHHRARVYPWGAIAAQPGVHLHKLTLSCYMACGYTINRAAARALIDANDPVRSMPDWPMDLSRIGARVSVPLLVEHPPVTEGQSLIAEDRNIKRKFGVRRYLTRAYLRRKWAKAIGETIS